MLREISFRRYRPSLTPGLLASAMLAVVLAVPLRGAEDPKASADLEAARALFERNLDAIRNQDTEAYLDCYLESPTLARTGPTGFSLGYEELAAAAGQGWPDVFEALDLRLVPVRPGVVYGTYRYRVRFGEIEQSGLSERIFVETPAGWRIAVSTAFPGVVGVPPPARVLVGATLIDGTGGPAVQNSVVVVRDGRIECAGSAEACMIPEDAERVNLAGRWVTPGLVDAHVHFSQSGWADGRPDALDARKVGFPYESTIGDLAAHPERFFRSQLCSGVTAVFDVGGYPWTLDLPATADRSRWAPHVVSAGPLLSTVDFWLNLPGERQLIFIEDEETAREGVRFLAARQASAVKVWFIVTPQRPLEESAPAVRAAAAEAEAVGLPLIVHATGLAEAKEAVRAGADLLVHGVDDQPVDEEFLNLLVSHGTIYTSTLTVPGGYVRLRESAAAGAVPGLDDPQSCVDPVTRERLAATPRLASLAASDEQRALVKPRIEARQKRAAENLVRVAEAGVPIAMGTDAGNPLTLHGPSVYAEMEAMQAAGMSPLEVLVASTRNGARAMGLEGEIGTLEPGKIADLLVLEADPAADVAAFRRLSHVMRDGVLRPVAELAPLPPAD